MTTPATDEQRRDWADERARRAYVTDQSEQLTLAGIELKKALLASDAVQAHTALSVADQLEQIAGALREGAKASGATPEPRPTSRTHTLARQ